MRTLPNWEVRLNKSPITPAVVEEDGENSGEFSGLIVVGNNLGQQ